MARAAHGFRRAVARSPCGPCGRRRAVARARQRHHALGRHFAPLRQRRGRAAAVCRAANAATERHGHGAAAPRHATQWRRGHDAIDPARLGCLGPAAPARGLGSSACRHIRPAGPLLAALCRPGPGTATGLTGTAGLCAPRAIPNTCAIPFQRSACTRATVPGYGQVRRTWQCRGAGPRSTARHRWQQPARPGRRPQARLAASVNPLGWDRP
jgi:hypothetical protein